MYTNIDLEQFFDIIKNKYNAYNIQTFGITLENLIVLFNINVKTFGYVENEACIINNKQVPTFFRQNKGIPMGGKLSYAISELVTSHAMQQCLNMEEMSFIFKYVDDILIGSSDTFIQNFTKNMKNFLPTMDLDITYESSNCSINYLDIQFTRKDRSLYHAWYTKEYASHRLVDYFSEHEQHIKDNLYIDLIKKAMKISNHQHQLIERKIRSIMAINHFPPHAINKIFSKANKKAATNTPTIAHEY